jgi:protein-S-isoprenylcysteine O-methyltransferase Ste14
MADPPRGAVWFALQSALFLALLTSPLFDRRRPPAGARLLGLGLLSGGGLLAHGGYRELGASHTPWTTPAAAGAELVTTGVYGRVRHPIYAGWCLGCLGFEVWAGSRVGVGLVGVLIVFYDLRSREEERLLAARYAGMSDYRVAVKRFVPGVY